MPLPDVAEPAPVERLRAVAPGDTGQSRTAAGVLLARWNAPRRGGFDLADLWAKPPKVPRPPGRGRAAKGVDHAAARDRVATAAFVAVHRRSSRAREIGPQFEQLVACRRPALAETGDA